LCLAYQVGVMNCLPEPEFKMVCKHKKILVELELEAVIMM